MIAPRMGGKRKARGAPNGGSIGVTSNAAIAIQTKRGPCQQEIEADFLSRGGTGVKACEVRTGMSIFCDLMKCPG